MFSSVGLSTGKDSVLSLVVGVSTHGLTGASTACPLLDVPLVLTANVFGLGFGDRDFFLFLDGS